ncbi:MAG: hypothetical protein HQK99_07740 [Nitrospirae bacterium]|nr:hypothetical protein [Nitrospirota bacterium]
MSEHSMISTAQARYDEIGTIINEKKAEIEFLQREYDAIAGYLINMGVTVDGHSVKKKRGRKPKAEGAPVGKKRGRKPKAVSGE